MDPREPTGINPYAPPVAALDTAVTAPRASGAYRPLRPLATALTVALGLHALVDLATVGNRAFTIVAMNTIIEGGRVPRSVLTGIDQRTVLLAWSIVLVAISTILLFCFYVARASRNAHSFRKMDLEATPGWAVGSFFVPFANLWKPYQAMREIWRASEPELGDPRFDPRAAEVPGLLPLWWGAYLVQGVMGNIAFRIDNHPRTPAALIENCWVHIVSCGTGFIAALLALAMVRTLATRQERCQAVLDRAAAAASVA